MNRFFAATKHWKTCLFLACILTYLVWLGLTHIWFSRTFEGQVVDHAGEPVEGAVVMVAWRFRGGMSAVPVMLKEARTDRNGRYVIEGWGPVFTPFGRTQLGPGEPLFHVVHASHPPLRLMSTPVWRSTRRLFDVAPGEFTHVRLLDSFNSAHDANENAATFDFDVYANLSVGDLRCRWNMVPMFVNEMRSLEKRLALSPARFSSVVSVC